MSDEISTVAMKWREELARGGYERKLGNWKEFSSLRRLSRTWKIILKAIKLKPGSTVFEFGCGGGNQLIPLALNNYKCRGIDCSEDVLVHCKSFIADAERFARKPLGIQLVYGDFLAYSSEDKYDLVFNFGVIEHFIDDHEREIAIKKMFSLCKPGGYVVSVVPNGQHPLRTRMRREGLGGYHVPEIDYNCASISDEMMKAGAEQVLVIPHNLFGYLLIDENISVLRKIFHHLFHYIAQIIPRVRSRITCKHAASLICIGRRSS
ncbi:MAG: class I SAM-dependent methyltransferase [Ignavibacteriales bacterium]|nr:class I SAM-dependent methyltransferase [Ignavibacteriales bacterium]